MLLLLRRSNHEAARSGRELNDHGACFGALFGAQLETARDAFTSDGLQEIEQQVTAATAPPPVSSPNQCGSLKRGVTVSSGSISNTI